MGLCCVSKGLSALFTGVKVSKCSGVTRSGLRILDMSRNSTQWCSPFGTFASGILQDLALRWCAAENDCDLRDHGQDHTGCLPASPKPLPHPPPPDSLPRDVTSPSSASVSISRSSIFIPLPPLRGETG